MYQPKITEFEHLRWGCRRGMLELDVLLIPFFDNHFNQLTNNQKHLFAKLLTFQDPELFAWFIGSESPKDPAFSELIQIIKNHVNVAH